MRERVLAIYHTLLATFSGYMLFRRGDPYALACTAALSFVAYVKWEEYWSRRR
jgi:hypothetical protein